MIDFMYNTSAFQVTWGKRVVPIFRILDKVEYINNFFEKGEIFISCFNNFRKYEDEMQGDKNEGEHLLGGFNEEGKGNFIFYEGGMSNYIMSTTSKLSKDVIKDFNGKGAIKINNPALFGMEVARKLPYVLAGLEGDCIYGDSKATIMESELDNNRFQGMDFKNTSEIKDVINDISNNVELFMKLTKYQHQNEYRLVWLSEKKINGGIVINCPEARHYCEKIIF